MPYENISPNITRPTAENYHALLFVGVCNRERYVLSLIRWTNLLHQMYGYPLAIECCKTNVLLETIRDIIRIYEERNRIE